MRAAILNCRSNSEPAYGLLILIMWHTRFQIVPVFVAIWIVWYFCSKMISKNPICFYILISRFVKILLILWFDDDMNVWPFYCTPTHKKTKKLPAWLDCMISKLCNGTKLVTDQPTAKYRRRERRGLVPLVHSSIWKIQCQVSGLSEGCGLGIYDYAIL